MWPKHESVEEHLLVLICCFLCIDRNGILTSRACIRRLRDAGMNVNSRELHHHIEFEPDHYYAAFSAELEICASTMWSILQHCQTPVSYSYYSTRCVTVIILSECVLHRRNRHFKTFSHILYILSGEFRSRARNHTGDTESTG